MKIAYIVAKRAEASPFIEHYGMEEVENFFSPLPCRLYKKDELHVILNGMQHESDLVGCEAASVTTLATIERLHPDLIINSGTCGAFKSDGAEIGKVYLGNACMFHDRRVPGDDVWGTQSLGNYPVWSGTDALAQQLGLPQAKVTTGSSLDMQPCDLEIIKANGGQLKDMEGAAIAFVCSLTDTPVMFVKSVTDLCDSGVGTFEEFTRNLAKASEALRLANIKIIEQLISQPNTKD